MQTKWILSYMLKHVQNHPVTCIKQSRLAVNNWFSVVYFGLVFNTGITNFLNFDDTRQRLLEKSEKYTSGPRYWDVPVLVNTGTFLVYQYCLKMWYLHSLERAGAIQKLKILGRRNGLVLSNTRVPVSGTWSILFPKNPCYDLSLR